MEEPSLKLAISNSPIHTIEVNVGIPPLRYCILAAGLLYCQNTLIGAAASW